MASGYTEHYGLCQWQGADAFLREEFNQDNEKIDAALKAADGKADRALSGLEAADYNIYNLLLQNEYEGKYTGYKKALLYDGFLDESGIASRDNTVCLSSRTVMLDETGQKNVSTGYTQKYVSGINTGETLSVSWTATGRGRLETVTLYGNGSAGTPALDGVTIQVSFWQGEEQLAVNSASLSESDREVTVALPCQVVPGQTYRLQVTPTYHTFHWYQISDSNTAKAYTLTFTPQPGTEGRVTSIPYPLGLSGETAYRLILRHSGGTVTPAVNGDTPLLTETRETVNLQRQSCTESVWEGRCTADTVTVVLDLAREADGSCKVYDYGICFL